MLTFTTYGQGSATIQCDSCQIIPRKVINLGIIEWRVVYQNLSKIGVIGSSIIDPDTVSFSLNSLELLYGARVDSSSQGTIQFNFYLNMDDTLPKIAIGNCASPDKFLIKKGGIDTIVRHNYLDSSFNNWSKFLIDRKSYLIHVTSYSYCWNYIGKKINQTGEKGVLYIENVAHTVSPLDTERYLLPTQGYEGYVAFELALEFGNYDFPVPKTNQMGLTSQFIDFAAPCPKNCYGIEK